MQKARESLVLRNLVFDNKLPSDPSEPDPAPKSDAKPKNIPQLDLNSSADGTDDSTTDFAAEGWPSRVPVDGWPLPAATARPTAATAPPAVTAPAAQPAAKLQDILSSFRPGLLEDIVSLATNFGNSTSPPAVSEPVVSLPPSLSVPPPGYIPENGAARRLDLPPPHRAQGDHYQHRGPQRGSRGAHRGRDYPYSRPCKFWMEMGNCKFGDNCSFSHQNVHHKY